MRLKPFVNMSHVDMMLLTALFFHPIPALRPQRTVMKDYDIPVRRGGGFKVREYKAITITRSIITCIIILDTLA